MCVLIGFEASYAPVSVPRPQSQAVLKRTQFMVLTRALLAYRRGLIAYYLQFHTDLLMEEEVRGNPYMLCLFEEGRLILVSTYTRTGTRTIRYQVVPQLSSRLGPVSTILATNLFAMVLSFVAWICATAR